MAYSRDEDWRRVLLPELDELYAKTFEIIYSDSALDSKIKEIVATAVSVALRCPHCTEAHLKSALKQGATKEQIAEALSVVWSLGGGTAIGWNPRIKELLL
jgi:AhpD family alkylhydroperoxidase